MTPGRGDPEQAFGLLCPGGRKSAALFAGEKALLIASLK